MTTRGSATTGRTPGRTVLMLCTAAFLAAWLWAWTALPPDGVVHHMSLDGPDSFGSRGGVLWPLLLVAVGLVLGLRWLVAVVLRSGDGTSLSYPHKDYWLAPERREEFRRRVADELDLFWGATLLLVSVGLVDLVRTTADPASTSWMLPATGFYLAFVAWWCWWMVRRSRPPAAS